MKIEILSETDDYIVINKPAGLIVHNDGRTKEDSVVDWFLGYYPAGSGIGESYFVTEESIDNEDHPDRSGIVHRLDRDTSGVMVIAKTQAMYNSLKQQFHNRETYKEYHAIVYGIPKKDKGIINVPIGRERGTERFNVPPRITGPGRESLTYWQVKYSLKTDDMNFALLRAMPKTGRTHQIRVHLKSIGHPIVADKGYVGKKLLEYTLGFSRQALHAYELRFKNLSEDELIFRADYPDDFNNAVSLFLR